MSVRRNLLGAYVSKRSHGNAF